MRPRYVIAVVLASFVAFASGCAGAAAGTPAGIAGRTVLGPLCPVQRPGEICVRPFQTTLILYSTPQRHRLKRLRTDSDGRFHFNIAPGHYIISAPHRGYPVARDASVTVRPHRISHVTLSFDTGIR